MEDFKKFNTQNRADLMLELMHCNARLINKEYNTENINNNFRPHQEEVVNDRIQPLQLQETRVTDPIEGNLTRNNEPAPTQSPKKYWYKKHKIRHKYRRCIYN